MYPLLKMLMQPSAPQAGQSDRPSCTVVLAMINSLETGDPLPGQPPGPFGSSDLTTMRELLYSPGNLGKPLLRCLRDFPIHPSDPSLGWAQAGEWQPLFSLAETNLFFPLYCKRPYNIKTRFANLADVSIDTTGRAGNVGIFYVGTKSSMDRRISQAIHANSVEEGVEQH